MPIEGIDAVNNATTVTPPPATVSTTPTDQSAQATPDAAVNNTGANQSGAGTDTAQQTQADQPKKFSQEDVDRIVQNRLKAEVKRELKKLAGDGEAQASVEDLQKQLSEQATKIRGYEASDAVDSYLNDGRNKLNIRPENTRGIKALVIPLLEYGDDGKPTNLKEAVDSAKSIAPALFQNAPQSIDAAAGRNAPAAQQGMSSWIREQAGFGN